MSILRPSDKVLDKYLQQQPHLLQAIPVGEHVVIFRTLDTKASDVEMKVAVLIREADIESDWPDSFIGALDDAVIHWIDGLKSEHAIDWHVAETYVETSDPTLLHSSIVININEADVAVGGKFVMKPSEFAEQMAKVIEQVLGATQE